MKAADFSVTFITELPYIYSGYSNKVFTLYHNIIKWMLYDCPVQKLKTEKMLAIKDL